MAVNLVKAISAKMAPKVIFSEYAEMLFWLFCFRQLGVLVEKKAQG